MQDSKTCDAMGARHVRHYNTNQGAVPYPDKFLLIIALDCIRVRLERHLRFNKRTVSAAKSEADDTRLRCSKTAGAETST